MKLCPKCQKQFSDDANFCPVDAARLVPLEGQASVNDSLSTRFELGERLGGSRTGLVHRAKDSQGTVAAVKLVAPAVVALPGVAQRLERELKQLERVQSAGVAKILASGKRDDDTWVALELLEGAQTLADAISSRGPIPPAEAAHLIEVIGEALIEAAQVGVVHRDLAPKNVLFAGQDIKLINFSLPVAISDKVPGVPEFVAPEQVDGKPVDQRSNLYSLGALYYYVLTGQTVHAGSVDEVHRAHVNGSIRTPSSLAPVPAPVEAVIMRALDRSPTKRFLTVRQFVDEVGRIARGEGEGDPHSTQAMGKAGRPKAELVQTLLGVRGQFGLPAPSTPSSPMPAVVPSAPIVPAPSVSPVAAVAPSAPLIGSTVIGMPAPTIPAAPSMPAAGAVAPQPSVTMGPERSPWAPPVAGPNPAAIPPMAGAAAVAVAAAPAVAAPVVAAPVVAAPQVAAAAAGKKKAPEEGAKGKFRETMWFKKGDLDAQAAQNAAEERAKTGKDVAQDKADSLPIDERYKDDGSLSRGDADKYSLRTGATQMMTAVRDPRPDQSLSGNKVSEDALIGEMKGGRNKIFIVIAIAIVVIALVAIALTR